MNNESFDAINYMFNPRNIVIFEASEKIWDAVFKQTPTIEVSTSLDDMIDYMYLFYNLINREDRLRSTSKRISRRINSLKKYYLYIMLIINILILIFYILYDLQLQ